MSYKFLTGGPIELPFMKIPLFLCELNISNDARLLYSFLMRRAELSSQKDEWFDENGHVFVYFTIATACEMLGCCNQKAVKTFKELENTGLIVKRNRRCVKPVRILLKTPVYRKNIRLKECDSQN